MVGLSCPGLICHDHSLLALCLSSVCLPMARSVCSLALACFSSSISSALCQCCRPRQRKNSSLGSSVAPGFGVFFKLFEVWGVFFPSCVSFGQRSQCFLHLPTLEWRLQENHNRRNQWRLGRQMSSFLTIVYRKHEFWCLLSSCFS